MDSILVDTNVLIAFLDSGHINHEIVLTSLKARKAHFLMATVSIIECLVKAYETAYDFAIAYELTILEFLSGTLDLTQVIASKAAFLIASTRASFVDAIIWATAEIYDLEIWTLDKRLANKDKRFKYLPI